MARKIKHAEFSNVQSVWEDIAKYGRPIGSDYGNMLVDSELVTSTGRARCRACGMIISKGEPCVDMFISFTDSNYNPWCSSSGKLHARSCCEPYKLDQDYQPIAPFKPQFTDFQANLFREKIREQNKELNDYRAENYRLKELLRANGIEVGEII